MSAQDITPGTEEMAAEHGLPFDEYAVVVRGLNRTPNFVELGIFSVMWSEHCSYKSSKVWLKKLPTEGPQVVCGPGENAGIVDIGDGQVAVFKMESHNHPSFIEPYQGAATGVGGIMRDVFTMGARPVANLNALRFGSPEHPKTRHLVSGVVAGIGGYGNCIGVPTVGGEVNFDRRYDGNILVNAMCVGIADKDKIFYSAASSIGDPVVYVGSKTGRDGIHGATMASAEFGEDAEAKRPTVQVGDPFTEKLLLEACLELMAGDTIVAIQDMGAAGLTSSSVEMAEKGGVGITLDLDKVPCRETNMTAYEMMLSESQERMLMVLKKGQEAQAQAIFEKWGLDIAIIGETNDSGHLVLTHEGEMVADIPLRVLADNSPEYERPWVAPATAAPIASDDFAEGHTASAALLTLMRSPDLCSRRWVWEQYDHLVMGDTVQRPGGDAAVVRVHGTQKALAVTADVTPRYCFADPREGGRQAVAETWRNLTAVGATPLAITDCMNFGNPERPEIMGQFAECIQGMAEACRALDYPVVSGNVSLYNETNGAAIPPTPAIGGVGLINDLSQSATLAFQAEDDVIILIGQPCGNLGGNLGGHLGASLYLREVCGSEDGAPPPVDLASERQTGDFIRGLILEGRLGAVHDISDGGLYVAIAEMSLASGIGADLQIETKGMPLNAQLFGEDQGRYIVTAKAEQLDGLLKSAEAAGVMAAGIGRTGGSRLTVNGADPISLDRLAADHEAWLPAYMAGP